MSQLLLLFEQEFTYKIQFKLHYAIHKKPAQNPSERCTTFVTINQLLQSSYRLPAIRPYGPIGSFQINAIIQESNQMLNLLNLWLQSKQKCLLCTSVSQKQNVKNLQRSLDRLVHLKYNLDESQKRAVFTAASLLRDQDLNLIKDVEKCQGKDYSLIIVKNIAQQLLFIKNKIKPFQKQLLEIQIEKQNKAVKKEGP